jgi:hypothetical protein
LHGLNERLQKVFPAYRAPIILPPKVFLRIRKEFLKELGLLNKSGSSFRLAN